MPTIENILVNGNIGEVPTNAILQGAIRNGIINGTVSATWNPRSGGNSKLIVTGQQGDIYAIARDCQLLGYEYNIASGAVFTMEIVFPLDIITNSVNSEPDPISFWEMNWHQIDKDVIELADRLFISKLTTDDKLAIEYKLKNPTLTLPITGPTGASRFVEAYIAYNLKLIGISGKAMFVPTLKRTAIIPTNFNINTVAGWNNSFYDGTVMSTATLVGRYNVGNPLGLIPGTIRSQLPVSTLAYDAYPPAGTKQRTGFVTSKQGIVQYVGWLQFPIDSQQIAINKVQVSSTWAFNLWSAGAFGLYDVVDGTTALPGPNPSNIVTGVLKVP